MIDICAMKPLALILLGALLVQAITFYCIKQRFYIVRNQASAADSLPRPVAGIESASI